jgi:branched-chain amino acid transport system permease protein
VRYQPPTFGGLDFFFGGQAVVVFEQTVLSGLTAGVLAALVAMGFALALGVLGIANFAHGNQIMLAMYLALISFRYLHLDPFVATPLIAPVMFLLGLAMYAVVVRPLVGKPQTSHVAATIGVMLLLQNVVNLFYGGLMRTVETSYANASIRVLRTYLPVGELAAAAVALLALLALYLVLNRTDFGLAMRACASNLFGARASGLPTGRVFAVAFAISVAAAGLAGSLTAAYQPMDPFVGDGFLSIAFAVMILAGAGDIRGTVLSGVLIGLIRSASAAIFAGPVGDAVLFGFVMIVLLIKPEGLFARS